MYIYMFCIDMCVSLCILMHVHILFMLNELYVVDRLQFYFMLSVLFREEEQRERDSWGREAAER
jgi:hypothetical protein